MSKYRLKPKFKVGDLVKLSNKGIVLSRGSTPWGFIGAEDVGVVAHSSLGLTLYYVRFFAHPEHLPPYLEDEIEPVEAGDVQVQGG